MVERILVVEDDAGVRTFLEEYLESKGYRVQVAADGAAMLRTLAQSEIDLVILDLSLPDEDGIDLARRVRAGSDVPIIMVTGRGATDDRVLGLEAGADDYLPKPFDERELLARVRSVLRRRTPGRETTGPGPTSARFAGWTLDLRRRRLTTAAGEPVHLTAAEFDLLAAFVTHPDRVLSRNRLLDLAYGRDMAPFERSIDILVLRLRRKIETDSRRPVLIKTVRGGGYLFTPEIEWS